MPRAFVSIGSNIDPEANLLAAVRLLRRRVRVVAVSTVYRTPAEGRPEQPDYYNGVVEIGTELPPQELKLGVLRAIEEELGRRRTVDRFAARAIDLDLLLYDDLVVAEGGLRLPDPDLARRAFLAYPLQELAPGLLLPGSSLTLGEVAAGLSQQELTPLPEYTARLRSEVIHEP